METLLSEAGASVLVGTRISKLGEPHILEPREFRVWGSHPRGLFYCLACILYNETVSRANS